MSTTEVILKINENGRVVIPVAVRKSLGVSAGDDIILREEDGGFRIVTQQLRVAEARKRIRGYIKKGSKVVDELIAERRKAAIDESQG